MFRRDAGTERWLKINDLYFYEKALNTLINQDSLDFRFVVKQIVMTLPDVDLQISDTNAQKTHTHRFTRPAF